LPDLVLPDLVLPDLVLPDLVLPDLVSRSDGGIPVGQRRQTVGGHVCGRTDGE
jgi:hypothetical protein